MKSNSRMQKILSSCVFLDVLKKYICLFYICKKHMKSDEVKTNKMTKIWS